MNLRSALGIRTSLLSLFFAFAPALTLAGAPALSTPLTPSTLNGGMSASRSPDESFIDARYRVEGRAAEIEDLAALEGDDSALALTGTRFLTPWTSRAPISQLDPALAPAADVAAVQSLFFAIRDSRDWRWGSMPDFPRRIPWLYNADGCYLRAQKVARKVRQIPAAPVPGQVFAFGDLEVSAPQGDAYWWFHVAPVLRVGNQVYVLDPAVDPKAPLALSDWVSRITKNPGQVTLSLCVADSTDPQSNCRGATEDSWYGPDEESTLQRFLSLEWTAVSNVWDAKEALGDRPPWQ